MWRNNSRRDYIEIRRIPRRRIYLPPREHANRRWKLLCAYRTSAESRAGRPPVARSSGSDLGTRDTWELPGPSCAPVPGNGRIHERPPRTSWCLKAQKNIQAGVLSAFMVCAYHTKANLSHLCQPRYSPVRIRVRAWMLHVNMRNAKQEWQTRDSALAFSLFSASISRR